MRYLLLSLFVVSMITFTVVIAQGDNHQKEGVLLEEISIREATDKPETISFRLDRAHIPKIFKIKGTKPRLVLDFFDTRYSTKINNVITSDGQLIKSIRVGLHKDPLKTRVVVDLRTTSEYDFELDSPENEKTLILTFFDEVSSKVEGIAVDTEDKAKNEPSVEMNPPVDTDVDATHNKLSPVAGEVPVEQNIESQKAVTILSSPDKPQQSRVETDSDDTGQESEDLAKDRAENGSLEAEERVNQIIANIKHPLPITADPILLDVSFENTANDSEMVLFKLNDFFPPLVFGIEKGNPRVVCDFLDTDLADDVRPVIQTRGTYVSRIRTAEHPSPEKVRVVLDLVPNKNYDLQQVFFKEDNLFVIIISEFEKEAAPPLKTVPGTNGN